MKSINLEDRVLDSAALSTKEELKPLLDNLKINLTSRFGSEANSFKASDLTKKVVGMYGGVYKSLKDELSKQRIKGKSYEDEFFRSYLTYVASEATIQLLENGGERTLVKSYGARRPINFNLTLNKTDQTTLTDASKGICNAVLNSNSLNNVKLEIKSYLRTLGDYVLEKIDQPIHSNLKKKYKNATIGGKNFKVDGIKKPKNVDQKLGQPESDYKKGLEEVILDPVRRDDIVANEGGISIIETEVPCLLHYDPIEKRNPFFGFNQYLLFVGDKGTGKTMMARYGMTLAKEIGEKHNMSLSLVKLEFEDRWQYGPLENIRKQFSEISEGARPYVVFIDEIDTKIPSRGNGLKDGYRKDIIGEFLKFRGGGDYINKGNYIIMATTNEPNNIDPAILNVFKVENLMGPETPQDKLQVLYNNLRSGISQGYVQVKKEEWATIGEILGQYELTGRDLVNIANGAREKYRGVASSIPFEGRATAKEKMTRQILSRDGMEYVTTKQDIIGSITSQIEKEKLIERSYI
ncbi:AAA family ATPase [Candidatus Woesearchaeota archaeon]|nr:AAA family ATPase [Candidatus Woesearchaeota archaeon]